MLRDLAARTNNHGRVNIRGGRAPAPTSESHQKEAKTYQVVEPNVTVQFGRGGGKN